MSTAGAQQNQICPFYLKGQCSFNSLNCIRGSHADGSIAQNPKKIPIPCRDNINGPCPRGDACSYIHLPITTEKTETRPAPVPGTNNQENLESMVKNILIGLKESKEETKPTSSEICSYFISGNCKYGEKCTRSHDVKQNLQLKTPPKMEPNPATKQAPKNNSKSTQEACTNFEKGYCKYGNDCRYSHEIKSTSIPKKKELNNNNNGKNKKKEEILLERDKIFKYVISRDGKTTPSENFFKCKGYQYKIDRSKNTLEIIASPNQSEIGNYINLPFVGLTIFPTPNGIFIYDAEKLYKNSALKKKLVIDRNLNLTPREPLLFRIPVEKQAVRFKIQGNTIIFFVPYEDKSLKGFFFEEIRVYRYNKKSGSYEHSFNYKYQDFNITCASSTLNYLVISRLPFNVDALKTQQQKEEMEYKMNKQMELLQKENQKLASQIEYKNTKIENQNAFIQKQKSVIQSKEEEIQRKHRQFEEQKQIAFQLKVKASYQEKRFAALKQSSNARIESLKRQQKSQANIFRQNIIDRDPVDFFIFDPENQNYKKVLEYHKPADDVKVLDKKLFLVANNQTHEFNIQITPIDLTKINYVGCAIPEKLCPYF